MNSSRLTASIFLTLSALFFGSTEASVMSGEWPGCPGKKRALVVGGGGINGAYQVGAIWFLTHVLDCDFEHFIGTSTGAISAAILSQARSNDELRLLSDLLVNKYVHLRSKEDIVESHFAGTVRFLLPRWLGGTDGIGTLAPLEKALRDEIDPARVQLSKLTIPVVSLQSKRLNPDVHRPDSAIDLILGSASVPLAVDPRLARVWVRGRIAKFENSVLTVSVPALVGVADPKCQLRLDSSWAVSCKQLKTTVNIWQGFQGWVDVALELFEFSADSKERLRSLMSGARTYVEFTTYHQLIDGGVTDNVPLRDAIRVLKDKDVDTVFVIMAGHPLIEDLGSSEIHGSLEVLGKAFDLLWESYQRSQLEPLRAIEAARATCQAVEERNRSERIVSEARLWREQLEMALGREKMEEVEGSMKARFPTMKEKTEADVPSILARMSSENRCKSVPSWRLVMIDPVYLARMGTFEVKEEKIIGAVRIGCREAAERVVKEIPTERRAAFIARFRTGVDGCASLGRKYEDTAENMSARDPARQENP